MEQYFRIAIWMFCLVACLQAKPTPQCTVLYLINDLDFSSLNETSCGNVTFETPKEEVWSQSPAEALKLFIKELERVGNLNDCSGETILALQIAESVMQSTPKELLSAQDNSSEVQRENKVLKEFLESFQTFLSKMNSDFCIE